MTVFAAPKPVDTDADLAVSVFRIKTRYKLPGPRLGHAVALSL